MAAPTRTPTSLGTKRTGVLSAFQELVREMWAGPANLRQKVLTHSATMSVRGRLIIVGFYSQLHGPTESDVQGYPGCQMVLRAQSGVHKERRWVGVVRMQKPTLPNSRNSCPEAF